MVVYELLIYKDLKGFNPIISGYNFFNEVVMGDRAITFSNIHSSKKYKQDMVGDVSRLGFDKKKLLKSFRNKGAAYIWETFYNIRTEDYNLIKGLSIKDIENEKLLDLTLFGNTLLENPKNITYSLSLVGFDQGWEINIPFDNEEKLYSLISLFMKKAGEYTYDKEGLIKSETPEEKEKRKPWKDAFKTHILVIGGGAVKYAPKLKQFETAKRIFLEGKNNEISFIINNHYKRLINTPHFKRLIEYGFKEEYCLANKHFLESVDKI